jgi:hypothetical protein
VAFTDAALKSGEHRYFVPPDHARISIVFDLQADPLAGVVCDNADCSLPFVGWIGLTRCIERALDDARRPPRATAQASVAMPPAAPRFCC